MGKTELIKAIAGRTGQTQDAVEKVLTDLVETVKVELAAGGNVKIVGFGEWSVKHRSARIGRNPKTGEAIEIPEGNSVVFKAYSGLKNSV